MVDSAKIINSIIEKIKFVAGDEIILEHDFEEQLSAIKSNFNDAIKVALERETNKILIRNLTDLNYIDWGESKESKNLFKNYYKRTNSFLENKLWEDDAYYPLAFRSLMISDQNIRETFLVQYKDVHVTFKNVQKGLDSEDLKKINHYFVNISDRNGIKNSEKSISSLRDVLVNGFNQNYFTIIIYLLSNDRIISLSANSRQINSEEHIIQKDLKKVSNIDSAVHFHYHGHHNSDCLVMDTYEEAVKLRSIMTELRENRKIAR